ncbi:hypothetical protein LEP1GSC083_3265 [Leptospira interrogans serovar Pyrogenes str. L0374]|uniref:Uncharacterized protein n=1 Tax=Leptospira interrogans serovar Pyrogenes str. L0374 TaxID=1049928 RepID=M6K384_LEPIR|nr:hypothetical protein LEP1GSC077_0191 [Leptospira interrogans str. C10069]EMN28556.1 hypothetical protein LEP1GSC083_3265 [Leptospira interrogans serovar Pyrogenes str. L0374]
MQVKSFLVFLWELLQKSTFTVKSESLAFITDPPIFKMWELP